MAVRSAIAYMGRFVRRKLGVGSYLPQDVTASSDPTSLRVLHPELFDPAGGTLYYVNQSGADKFFTYTGINGDLLTGIPGSSSGEIDSDMYDFAESTNTPTLVYRGDLDDEELERALDEFKQFVIAELFYESSQEGKRWKTAINRPWFDTDAVVRDDDSASFNAITLGGSDAISYERGEVVFNTARTETQLWLAGFAFNPFATLANLILQHAGDDRFLSYVQAGQTAQSKAPAAALAETWRRQGAAISLLRG